MSLFAVPLIRSEHYETIRQILKGYLPYTYDEWLKLHLQEIEYLKGRGNTVVETPIYPDDFARACRATNTAPNLKTLENFAIEQAARKNK